MTGASTSAAAAIAGAAERLRRAGVGEARREALRLWADLVESTPSAALLHLDDPVAPAVTAEFFRRVERRAAGEPQAHVSGVAGFRRLTLVSDRRALIPRPETEGLVDLLLSRVRRGRVADVGTGTGCIALSLATEGRFDAVLAIDRSAEALALARENGRAVLRGSVASPISFVLGDLCTALGPATLDALVSNPPYLTEREYAGLDASVRNWEPAAALVSGADGLAATLALLEDGRRVLRPGGWLAIELDCTRAGEVARRAIGLGWTEVAISNDLFGRERYLLARRSETS